MCQLDRAPSRARFQLRSISRTEEEEEEEEKRVYWNLTVNVGQSRFPRIRMLENTGFYEHGFREAIASDTLAALIKGRRSDTSRISKEEVVVKSLGLD